MWGWILCVMLGLAVLVLGMGALSLVLFRKNKALKQEIKKLLNDSRAMVDKEKRNPDDIYFHVDDNLNISFINDTVCQYFKINKNQWLNQPILGKIIENTPANLVYLNSTLNRLKRNPSTINETIAVKSPSGKMRVMKIRIRPILNEILNCVGMSIVLKDAEETKLLQDKLSQLKNRDTLSKGILNQDALFDRVDKDIDNGSALVHIVCGHFTDVIQKSMDLRLCQANLLVLLNGKLFFEFCFFSFSFVDSFRQHFNRLSEFDAPPKIFNSRINFFNCFS